MRWILLLVVGVAVLAIINYFWRWVPVIGLAAGLGYWCGYIRGHDSEDE